MVSLWCELLCELSMYTLRSDQLITKWWAKFELECLLLIFIYSNSKFKLKSLAETRTLNASTSDLIPKKNGRKLATLHSLFCPFLMKILWSLYFSWSNHQMRFKIVHSNTKNAKTGVRQSQMCYLRATHSALKSSIYHSKADLVKKMHVGPKCAFRIDPECSPIPLNIFSQISS